MLNGKIVTKAGQKVKEGIIEIDNTQTELTDIKGEDIPLDIIYEDEDLAVINKPQGMVVHPACGNRTGTLVNACLNKLDHLSGINGEIRPGIVHRIDKDTSGLLVVAKNNEAHLSLSKQIQDKTCSRHYIALLEGVVKEDTGEINAPIGRSKTDRKKMAVIREGRQAKTTYKVIERFKDYTLCEFILSTGRTHQIRVHAKHINHPVVGDKVYGYKKQRFDLNGQLLHAYKLGLVHPRTKEQMEFVCGLPEYFKDILKILRQ